MPFGHSHLMSNKGANGRQTPARQNNQIAFGKLSIPNGGGGKKQQGLPPTHPPKNSKVQNGRNGYAGGMSNSSANGNGKKSKAPKAKRTQDADERQAEMEWQNSGLRGGPVAGWGKDLDREEKAAKRVNQGSHAKGKARATGQKYLGGY